MELGVSIGWWISPAHSLQEDQLSPRAGLNLWNMPLEVSGLCAETTHISTDQDTEPRDS